MMYMGGGLCVSKCVSFLGAEEAESYGSLGAAIPGGCEPPNVGDGN